LVSFEINFIMPVNITAWFPNRIAVLLFIIVFYLWAASELFNTFGFRRSRHIPAAPPSDRGSYWIILLIVWGSMIVSFLARALNLGVFHDNLQSLGLALAAFGVAFREWAVLSLGRFFTVAVTIHHRRRPDPGKTRALPLAAPSRLYG
jgi:hypothetical protein